MRSSEPRVELAILPSGTLNHLAKDLSLPLELKTAARVAHRRPRGRRRRRGRQRSDFSQHELRRRVRDVRPRARATRANTSGITSRRSSPRCGCSSACRRFASRSESREWPESTSRLSSSSRVGERELKLPTLGARVPDGKTGLHVMVIRRRSGARALASPSPPPRAAWRRSRERRRSIHFSSTSASIEPRTQMAAVDGELVRVSPPLEYRHVPGRLRVDRSRTRRRRNRRPTTTRQRARP